MRTVVPSVIVGVRIVPAAAVVKIRVVWLRRRAGTGAAAPGTAGAAAARPAAAVVIVRRGVCSQLWGIVIPVRELAARTLIYRVALRLRRRLDLRGLEGVAVRGLGAGRGRGRACRLHKSGARRQGCFR